MENVSIDFVTEAIRPLRIHAPSADASNRSVRITGVSTDSRDVQKGACFFAIPGAIFDGHDYVADAFAAGAACAVVSKEIKASVSGTLLVVEDVVKALGDLARAWRNTNSFKVIGITGSVGKTTTRQIVTHVLQKHFRTVQAEKNFNNHIGLPLTVLRANSDTQVLVAELGMNQPGEIAYLSRIASPDIAVVTNVAAAHIEAFESIEAIAREKLSIAEGLRENGVLMIGTDLQRKAKELLPDNIHTKTFGLQTGSDVCFSQVNEHGLYSDAAIGEQQLIVPLPGRGNVMNALAAWAVCKELGVEASEFAESLKTFRAPSMRLEIHELRGIAVISDCYNANPASMSNALGVLRQTSAWRKRRSVFICGEMAELGEHAEKLHEELGKEIRDAGVQMLIATGPWAKTIALAAQKKTSPTPIEVEVAENCEEVCKYLRNWIQPSDIVLVKGSRVSRLEGAVEQLRKLYD